MRITCASCGETFDPEQLTIPAELAELGDDASAYCTIECRDAARD